MRRFTTFPTHPRRMIRFQVLCNIAKTRDWHDEKNTGDADSAHVPRFCPLFLLDLFHRDKPGRDALGFKPRVVFAKPLQHQRDMHGRHNCRLGHMPAALSQGLAHRLADEAFHRTRPDRKHLRGRLCRKSGRKRVQRRHGPFLRSACNPVGLPVSLHWPAPGDTLLSPPARGFRVPVRDVDLA